MTFAQLKTAVKDHCNLTSTEADTRVGKSLNRHYRRITSSLGLDVTRFVTRTETTTNGVQTVTFPEIEKIDRIFDTTDSTAIRLLQEISIHTQRATQPSDGEPTTWAFQNTDADSVVVRLDTVPQTTYTLQADGTTTLSDLTASDEPIFPESYHDILSWFVIAEELLKKEKPQLAAIYEQKAESLLSDLRFYLNDSATRVTRQGGSSISTLTGGGGSGGAGTTGTTSYTQSALLTFDRGAGVAPFAVLQATAAVVTNLDADKLDGQHGSYYLDRANHTGTMAGTSVSFTTADRLLGRDGASTAEISVTGGIEFSGSDSIRTTAFTGDVTKTAGGTAQTIANDAVTYAKMQNVSAASRVLGRGSASGAGDPEEITPGVGLEMATTTLNVTVGSVCEGRLTLTTGTPVTTSDVTGAGTLYYTPYTGNRVALYSGSAWALYTFAERSLALTLTSGVNYDVFLWNNSGTITLETTAWTNDTTRTTALVYQDGVLVKSGSTTRRYLGTIRASGSNTTEDSYAKRFVWNYRNRVARPVKVLETTNSWNYTTATWRQANAAAANQIAVVAGQAEDALLLTVGAEALQTGGSVIRVAIGEDSTSTPSTSAIGRAFATGASSQFGPTATGIFLPAVGYHYYAWLEWSTAAGTTTWYGDNGGTDTQSGIVGVWRA